MRSSPAPVRLGGVAGMCGGALLVAKRLWDYFGRGRVQAHTGYLDKDVTDYCFFLVPLAILVAIVGLWRSAGGTAGVGKANLIVALLGGGLQVLGEFGEAWFPHGMPWGLLGGSGFILTSVGLIWLGLWALRRGDGPAAGVLSLLLGLLVPLQIITVMLPYHLWGDEFLSAQAGLAAVVAFGLAWIVLGYVLWSHSMWSRS